MSSKQDNGASATWSITGRLTALYTLATLTMLSLATAFLYSMLVSNLEREDQQFLADKIQVLTKILHEHGANVTFLEEEVRWEGRTSVSSSVYSHYSRIIDATGHTLIETPGMDELIPPTIFVPADRVTSTSSAGSEWLGGDGRAYLLATADAQPAQPDKPTYQIQVALDNSHEQAVIAEYQRQLVIVMLGGLLFAGSAGVVIARRGLRPLQVMTQVAQRITGSQLHERVDPALWPKELAALAAAFDQMLARLEDAFARLSQFSADLAHELRTPINNLMGEAEVALTKVRSPDEYRRVLESSLEEYARLARMIDSLLFLARTDNAQFPVERSHLDGRHELEALREFHSALAEEQGVAIHCAGNAWVDADPILLRRVVSNLLSNALHHTPAGGQILLAARTVDAAWVEISVSDTGCGIAAAQLPKIFERFYRGDNARAAHPHGTGLGLAIVQSIMALHGGSAQISSQVGNGTTVTLRFPVAPSP